MPKRVQKISRSLRELGDIQVNSWEFPKVFQKDIKDLEIGVSLRRLGRVQVTDWDFKDVLPAVNRVAHKEIDIDGFVRKAANYRVVDWDFRDALRKKTTTEHLAGSLSEYLRFLMQQLIDEPKYLSIHYLEVAPRVLKFEAIMTKRDSSMLIGLNGRTAGPIRRLLKDSAELHGAKALLEIKSHEEATAQKSDSLA